MFPLRWWPILLSLLQMLLFLVEDPYVALVPGGVVTPLSCGVGTSSLTSRDLGDACGLDDFAC